ncbi:helix-turn-helix domain-containing protein [Trinickia dinghuensis]|uniref:Helix-turn-helix domain-containing protein n=1 Tax=Trinickia dinghuensis TaxID=2291023 RepID=A0A3D8JWL0_9BURK|nr:helix-turn-helix transcriptional regulator [Trinickia dinghuensis]RDU97498.1 helix-turn-helix domain-containing protein [Trinickia dinghuensis]
MARTLPRSDASLSPLADDLAALGRIVRNQRARSELRIDDASALVGVTHNVLSKIENGQSVGLEKLFKVLNGLGLKLLVVTPSEAEDAVDALRPQPEDNA